MIAGSNRFQLVDREHIYGGVNGINFGYNLSCLVRSPDLALLWSGGTMYTSCRQSVYGTSSLALMYRKRLTSARSYRDLGPDGGRLSMARIEASRADIEAEFGDDIMPVLIEAIRKRQTVLVDGGGEAFSPRFVRHRT